MKALISIVLILLVTSSLAKHHSKKDKHQHRHELKSLLTLATHFKQTRADYQQRLDFIDNEIQTVQEAINSLQADLNDEQTLARLTQDAFSQMDTDEDGQIGWEEFQDAIDVESPESLPATEDIRNFFDEHDTDHNNGLDPQEFRAVIVDLYGQAIESLEQEIVEFRAERKQYEDAFKEFQVDHPAPIHVSEVVRQEYEPAHAHDAEQNASHDEGHNENGAAPQSHEVSQSAGQNDNDDAAPQSHETTRSAGENENDDAAPQSHETTRSAGENENENEDAAPQSEEVSQALFLMKNQNSHKHKLKAHRRARSHTA